MNQRHVALALFLSVGLNLFLLGSVASRHSRHRERPHHFKAEKETKETKNIEKAERAEKHGPERPWHLRENPRERGPHASRGPDGPAVGGDLALLRELISVMGGPKDPRVKSLWNENGDAVRTHRKQMREAHEQIRKALLSEPFREAALKDAFADLRARTGKAQEQAQAAVLQLSTQLTEQERDALRKLQAHGNQKPRGREREDKDP